MKKIRYIIAFAAAIALLAQCTKDGGTSESFAGTGMGGSTARFAIVDDHLYSVDLQNLHIFSLKNPPEPKQMGVFPIGEDIETIYPFNNLLFVGSMNEMLAIDVTSPQQPLVKAKVDHIIRSCDPVVADSNYAFVTLRYGTVCSRGLPRLQVIGIGNLSAASIIREYTNFSNPGGIALDGDWLFVADNSIKMLDRSNVYNITTKHTVYGVAPNDLIASNGLLIATAPDGIYQYKYSSGTLQYQSKILKAL